MACDFCDQAWHYQPGEVPLPRVMPCALRGRAHETCCGCWRPATRQCAAAACLSALTPSPVPPPCVADHRSWIVWKHARFCGSPTISINSSGGMRRGDRREPHNIHIHAYTPFGRPFGGRQQRSSASADVRSWLGRYREKPTSCSEVTNEVRQGSSRASRPQGQRPCCSTFS